MGSEPIPFQLPLVCFAMHQPVDGFPCLADWLNTLNDIACGGFEAHREPTEIRPLPTQTLGQRLGPLRVVPTKGWGRLSCVWFCLLYTWKAGPGGRDLNDEEMAALKRPAVFQLRAGSNSSPLGHSYFGLLKGEEFAETVVFGRLNLYIDSEDG